MKSIYDIRRENLNEIIRRDFDNTQLRFAERVKRSQNLVNRWCTGIKNIGPNAARLIEEAARKERFWLDVDHGLSAIIDDAVPESDDGEWTVEKQAAATLNAWMRRHPDMTSEKKVADAAGVGAATVNRIMKAEVSTTIGVLSSLARAFGHEAYEMILPVGAPGIIEYDHGTYAELPQEEKNKITSFINFVFEQNRSK
ncbi:helix-turn-helix domain-containing protein [Escherichia coli]|nr:helix-turn-helix domain-containing protein [Escherichia coli]